MKNPLSKKSKASDPTNSAMNVTLKDADKEDKQTWDASNADIVGKIANGQSKYPSFLNAHIVNQD